MFSYIKKLVLGGLLVCMAQSCQDALNRDPISALDAAIGFTTRQDAEAALIGCYNALQSANYMGLRYWLFADMYADNISHVGTFPSFAQIVNRTILADNVEGTNMWNIIYSGINRCNNVIVSAERINDPAFAKQVTLGEARLLRAFHYFNLLRYYGGTPAGFNKSGGLGVVIKTEPTLTPEDATPRRRSTEAEVWKLILDDIDFAIANLQPTGAVGRVNRRVAVALKARAHLYREEWAQAETAASEIINLTGATAYRLLPTASYTDLYLTRNSSEAIWELQFDANNTNSIAFFYYPTTLGGRNEVSSSASLRTAHQAADIRLPVNVIATPTSLANKTQKYSRVAGTDNVILIRLAEMYLIRAEARLAQNKQADALADLNQIITRAGLPALVSTSNTEILDRILLERRLEFAHEGHRYFDLRRLGRLASIGFTQPFRALWPIPQREVDTSEGTTAQNPEY